MTIPKKLQPNFDLFIQNADAFFEALNTEVEPKKISLLEFQGVILRASSLILFAMELINSYLSYKKITKSQLMEKEQVISLAYQHNIITDEEEWQVALQMMHLFFFSNDKECLEEIVFFINEVLQDMIIELHEYFAEEFDLED